MAGPFINGDFFSFADVDFSFEGAYIAGIKSINYSDELGRTYVRGAARNPLGTTAGHYEPKADFEIFLPTWIIMLPVIQAAGAAVGGWMRFPFDISVSYAAGPNLPVITDIIRQATIKSVEAAQSESEDALVRKITLNPMQILWGGTVPGVIETNVAFAIG